MFRPLFAPALVLALAPPAADELKLSADEKALVELTNAERAKADLPALRPSRKLFEAARGHAANMAKQDKLEHDLDGKTAADRVSAAGYTFARAGENIGWNARTPKDAVAGWMESPPHRGNILTREFTEVGVGTARNEKGEPYWVQVFAAPRD